MNPDHFKKGMGAQALSPLKNLQMKKEQQTQAKTEDLIGSSTKPELPETGTVEEEIGAVEEELKLSVVLFPTSEFTETVFGQIVDLKSLKTTLDNFYAKPGNVLTGRLGPVVPLTFEFYKKARETGCEIMTDMIKRQTETPANLTMFEITDIKFESEGVVGTIKPKGPFAYALIQMAEQGIKLQGYPRYVLNSNLELRIATFDVGPSIELP